MKLGNQLDKLMMRQLVMRLLLVQKIRPFIKVQTGIVSYVVTMLQVVLHVPLNAYTLKKYLELNCLLA